MLEANQLLQGLIQYTVLLFSLSVHESSHAWVAGRLGDPTARDLGRVTLNRGLTRNVENMLPIQGNAAAATSQ